MQGHFLEGAFDSALSQITTFLVPSHSYKSVHDYFNPQLFQAALLKILENIPQLSTHIDSITALAKIQNGGSNQGFVEVRVRNFQGIWRAMQRALQIDGHQSNKQMTKDCLEKMAKDYSLDELQIFLQHLFELLIKDHGAVEYITELPASDQAAIKDMLQKSKGKASSEHNIPSSASKDHEQDMVRHLEQENLELRQVVSVKESDLNRMSQHIQSLEEQIQELRQLENAKENQIDSLKKRLIAYQETDTLFMEKDQEINKLHKTVTELQLENRLLTADLASLKSKQDNKMADLEQLNVQLQSRVQKLSSSLQSISRQKDQIEQSNKKVIANLKEKIKGQTDRISQMQGQMVESKISRELRERQFSQLWANYESLRSQSVNEGNNRGAPNLEKMLSGDLQKGIIGSSGGHQFLRLGQEINELDKLQDNAFEEEIMMFESSQDNLKKVQQIIAENAKLKERLTALQTSSSRGMVQQNEKLKKKLVVMKKRNEELDNQRKEELDLLVSAFENCLRSKSSQ